MDINKAIETYFIPRFIQWNLGSFLRIVQVPQFTISRFIIVDNTLILKLMYHCGEKWSFVKVDKQYKADPSDQLIFITHNNPCLLLECIQSFHQLLADIHEEEPILNSNLPFLRDT
jgi:hypothetical protein